MSPDDIYRQTRGRMLEMAAEMDLSAQRTPTPALPGWTVRDVYGHLAGLCADVLDGETEGAPGPVWTQAQVGSRHRYLLNEVCQEWKRRGPALETLMTRRRDWLVRAAAFDAWHHEQDVRGALGVDVDRADPAWRSVVDELVAALRRREDGEPAVLLCAEDGEWTLGEGEPTARLRVEGFELARLLVGRRSHAQIEAMDWEGDPRPHLDRLHLFDAPERDLKV